MSVSAEQVTKFFETKGQDDSLNATLREAIPAPVETPVEADVSRETSETKPIDKPVEAKPEVSKAEDKPIPDVKFVPLEALQEERAEKKALKQELEQFKQWQSQIQEQLKQLPKAQQEQAPDPNQDPFGYQNWALQQLGASVQDINQWRQQQEQAVQRQNQVQQYAAWANSQEAEFSKTEPKYPEAYRFAADIRDKELQVLGYSNPQIRQNIIAQNTAEIINNALQLGVNPAKLVWDYALTKGFNAKSSSTIDPNAQAKIAAGQAAAPKLDKGGQTADSEMTAKDLANISDPIEFEKQWKKIFGKK